MLFETLLCFYGNFKETFLWEHGLSFIPFFLFFLFFSCLTFSFITFFYDSLISLITTKLLRERSNIFGAFILVEPNQDIFVHSWCRSIPFFLVDPKWNVCLAPTPSVGVVQNFGGVYVILVLKAWQISWHGSTKLDKAQCNNKQQKSKGFKM